MKLILTQVLHPSKRRRPPLKRIILSLAFGAHSVWGWSSRAREREMMGCLVLYNSTLPINTVSKSVTNLNGFNFPATFKTSLSFSSSSTSRFTVNCRDRTGEEPKLSDSSAYAVLGVDPSCSAAELKAAFRAKVWKKIQELFDLFCLAPGKMEEKKIKFWILCMFFFAF